MKQFFLSMAIALSAVSCTESQLADKKPELPVIAHPEWVEIRKSFTDIPLNSTTFCSDQAGRGCVQTYQLLLAQLMVLDPIPVPQSGIGQTISTSEATDRYKAFVAQYSGEPILAAFKQIYPRILLTKYGILDGSDYAQLTYFTQQLVEAKSFDHVTLTAALKRLKPTLAPSQFNALKAWTLEAIRKQRIHHDAEITELSNTSTTGRYSDGVSARLFPKEIRAQFIDSYKSDIATMIKEADELNQL